VPSSRSIPPSPRASSPHKPAPNSSLRGSARLAPPSPTKRSPIPGTALKKSGLATGRASLQESSLPVGGSAGLSRDDPPDPTPHIRALQFRQVSSPAQPQDRSLPSTAQAPTSVPTSTLTSPPPPTYSEPKDSVRGPPNLGNGPTARLGVNDEELQTFRAKIRILEIKRADDARHIQELETKLNEAESFVALRPKLQAKLMQLQTELIDTRRELADARQLSELSESRNLDSLEQLEMTMLDKEVAEERAEAAEAELEEMKEKLAVVEVELEVIKEGACECAIVCFTSVKLTCVKQEKEATPTWPAL
jgi:dynactin 1